MRINVSTLFQVLALIAQDVLAFESQQKNETPQLKVETPSTTDSQTPVQ
ncbi:MAG: hypothetical protein V7L31_06340 [Nostoc sp.]